MGRYVKQCDRTRLHQFVRGKIISCITYHGEDLMGVAGVPPLAGRSPSYIVRQMWDIQQGTRNSEPARLMKSAIANLDGADLAAIAAYVSSLGPAEGIATTHKERRQ